MQDNGRKFLADVSKLIEEYWDRMGFDYGDVYNVAETDFQHYLMCIAAVDGEITWEEAEVVSEYFGKSITPRNIEMLLDGSSMEIDIPVTFRVAVQIDNGTWKAGNRDICIAKDLLDLYKSVGKKLVLSDVSYGGEYDDAKFRYYKAYIDGMYEYFRCNDKMAVSCETKTPAGTGLLTKMKRFWTKRAETSESDEDDEVHHVIDRVSIAEIKAAIEPVSELVSCSLPKEDFDENTDYTKAGISTYMTYISAIDGVCQWSEANIISEILETKITPDKVNEVFSNNKKYFREFLESVPISIKVAVDADNKYWDRVEQIKSVAMRVWDLYWLIGLKLVYADGVVNERKKDAMDRYLKMLMNYIQNEDELAEYLIEQQQAGDNGDSAVSVKFGVSAPRKR